MRIKKFVLVVMVIITVFAAGGCTTYEEDIRSYKYIRIDGLYFKTKDIIDIVYTPKAWLVITMKNTVKNTTFKIYCTTCISTNEILPQDEEELYERNKNILV